MQCPCKSTLKYEECCQKLIERKKEATTPLELMRSRYSAFVLGEVEYLIYSDIHSSKADKEDLLAFSKGVEWIGLNIIEAKEDTVEFKAYYNLNGKTEVLHEKSNFIKVDGIWKYDSGELYNTKLLHQQNI
ncbi:UPF0225 protein YchJ [hydrothermal vent metagenome]|uniref:UPF0225 protein YchJ n=1 Tax=hydrothermal vent metagenome TaxID=652676 RepID=A0A1W1B8W9_9ZZZZ